MASKSKRTKTPAPAERLAWFAEHGGGPGV